jgi:hypothetical protein
MIGEMAVQVVDHQHLHVQQVAHRIGPVEGLPHHSVQQPTRDSIGQERLLLHQRIISINLQTVLRLEVLSPHVHHHQIYHPDLRLDQGVPGVQVALAAVVAAAEPGAEAGEDNNNNTNCPSVLAKIKTGWERVHPNLFSYCSGYYSTPISEALISLTHTYFPFLFSKKLI